MLQREGEDVLITGQAWGASWEKLEEELKTKIEEAKREQKEAIAAGSTLIRVGSKIFGDRTY